MYISKTHRVTLDWLEKMVYSFEDDGMVWEAPKCHSCKKEVGVGGIVDHLWPYHGEQNRCPECEIKDIF